ncbi:MAG: hypothetical protein AAF234_11605 [Pseudomonadota bacterium]
MLELLLASHPSWLGGFVDFMKPGYDWSRWDPSEHNLIIVDYASTFREQVRNLFVAMEERSGAGNKIRIILADRGDTDTLVRQLFTGSDMDRFLMNFSQAPIELLPLTHDQVEELSVAIRGHGLEAGTDDRIALSDENRFPLFAAMIAHFHAEGIDLQSLDRLSLVRRWLDRERDRFWEPAGVSMSEIRLACLASISGPIAAEEALSGALQPCGINIDEVQTHRYEVATGVAPLDRFEPLTPDILGEYLVLEMLHEQNPANARSKALLQAAWGHSAESTAGFLKRLCEDFPEHPVAIGIVAFIPEDVPLAVEPPTVGRPTLPTLWVEAIPFLPVTTMYHKHGGLIFDVVLAACQTPLNHENMRGLRSTFNDQIFEDPLFLDSMMIRYSSFPQVWDFAEARDLGLRLSDIRWRLAFLLDNLLRNLTGFDEPILDKIVQSTCHLLESGQADRRIRRVLTPGVLEGINDRFAAADIPRARQLWLQTAKILDWWLSNPDKRADPTSATQFGHHLTNERDIASQVEQPEPPSELPEEKDKNNAESLQVNYVVFTSGEEQSDALFVDSFGKMASNFIQGELTEQPVEDLRFAHEAFERLLSLGEALDGQHELPGRIMEGAAFLVQYHVRTNDTASSERLILKAREISSRYLDAGRNVTPGLPLVLLHKVLGHIASDELSAASDTFDTIATEVGVPNFVQTSELRTIGAVLVNLAGMHGSKGDLAGSAHCKTVLDQIAEQSPDAEPALLASRIVVRRNELVLCMQSGLSQEVRALLSSVSDLAKSINDPQEAAHALSAVDVVLNTQDAIDEHLSRVVASLAELVCMKAYDPKFGITLQTIVGSCHRYALQLLSVDTHSVGRIVDAASALAVARFTNGQEVARALQDTLESARD